MNKIIFILISLNLFCFRSVALIDSNIKINRISPTLESSNILEMELESFNTNTCDFDKQLVVDQVVVDKQGVNGIINVYARVSPRQIKSPKRIYAGNKRNCHSPKGNVYFILNSLNELETVNRNDIAFDTEDISSGLYKVYINNILQGYLKVFKNSSNEYSNDNNESDFSFVSKEGKYIKRFGFIHYLSSL